MVKTKCKKNPEILKILVSAHFHLEVRFDERKIPEIPNILKSSCAD